MTRYLQCSSRGEYVPIDQSHDSFFRRVFFCAVVVALLVGTAFFEPQPASGAPSLAAHFYARPAFPLISSVATPLRNVLSFPGLFLPSSVDLSADMPPVGDQKDQGSCTAWAAAYYYKSFQERKEHNWQYTNDHIMSPSYIYNQFATSNTWGPSSVEYAFQTMYYQGVSSLGTFPYNDHDYSTQPSQQATAEAANFKISGYQKIYDRNGLGSVDSLKAHLAAGDPFVMAIPLYGTGFEFLGPWNALIKVHYPTIIDIPSADVYEIVRGGHAVTVVGYDDTMQWFKFVNSWGTDTNIWGDPLHPGYGYITYAFVLEQFPYEAWSMTNLVPQQCYYITKNVNPSGSGAISVDTSANCGFTGFKPGTNVQLTARPSQGYSFHDWTGSQPSTNNPIIITMNGDKNVTANFDYVATGDTTPPSGYFTGPANGTTITNRSVTVSVNATDNSGGSGVKEVRYSAKWAGTWYGIGTDSSSPYSINWDMCNSNVPDGDIELGMEVWDNAGNKYVWSEHGANPHITKSYTCSGGNPVTGGPWNAWMWQNKYLAGYTNWEGTYTWPDSYPYVHFDWGTGAPFAGWGSDEFSMRIWRNVYFPGGHYDFFLDHDDGARLWVDGNLTVDVWWDGHNGGAGGRDLSTGYHEVRIEYYENTGNAFMTAWWYGAGYPRPDNNPPDGRITAPSNLSATSQSPLSIWADASDDASGVNRVEFYSWYWNGISSDWRIIGTDYSAPYTIDWNWSGLSDQHVWIKIVVYDNTGKSTDVAGGWVEVDLDRSKPSLSFVQPLDGTQHLNRQIQISISANDAGSGVNNVQFFAGYDDPQGYWHVIGWDSDGSNGWGLSWDSSALPDGTVVSFFVYAYDKAENYEGAVVWNNLLGQYSTSTIINSSTNPSLVGQSVVISATVSVVSPGTGTPTGIVTFKDGASTFGSASLSGGVATLITSGLVQGSHSITAIYAGNTKFAGSTSSVLNQTVYPSVPNDDFNSAKVVATTPYSDTLDTAAATTATDDPNFTCGNQSKGSASVWYRFTPSTSGQFNLNTVGSGYDTMLAVWSGVRGGLVSLACNDDSNGRVTSSLLVNLTAGMTYSIEVARYTPGLKWGGGLLILNVMFSPPLADSAWPMSLHDARHTSQSSYNGPSWPSLAWSYVTTSTVNPPVVESSPVIAPDGTIYITEVRGNVYAINPNGTLKWNYSTGQYAEYTSAAVAADGTLYLNTDNRLFAFDNAGRLKWTSTCGGGGGAPTIGPDGIIYDASFVPGDLCALNSDGSIRWRTNLGTTIFLSSPALAPDGTLYIGSGGGGAYQLNALNSNGTLKWAYSTADVVWSSPALGPDGTIYVSAGSFFYAINPNGTLKWGYATKGGSSPSVAIDGTIYVSGGGYLFALDSNGSTKWYVAISTDTYSAPAIGANGTVYLGSADHKLYSVAPDGNVLWAWDIGNEMRSSPAIGTNNTLYVGASDGRLYALTQGNIPTPTTTIASSLNPSVVGQSVTLTATVTVGPPALATPTGTVTFKDGTTTLATVTLISGTASIPTAALSAGSHSITAVYSGDSHYPGSTSVAITQTVNKANTATTVGSSPNPSAFGQSVTFTAAVGVVAPGSGTPSGTVTFKDGAAAFGSAALSGGIATLTTSALGPGSHAITAVYSGDANFNASTSDPLSQLVTQPLPVLYAKPSATGTGACSSWANACTLPTALAAAVSPSEIWVQQGTHKPTLDTDRTATFQLKNGVGVYGGFAGTETARNQRNPATNVTTLSGDIGTVGDTSDNSYHVVTAISTDTSAILDGFTLAGGNANGDYSTGTDSGGGMLGAGTPTLTNLTFAGNSAIAGGGMYNSGNPTLTNVTFSNNSATGVHGGGGMYNYGSPLLTNVTFADNSATHSGGGLFNFVGNPIMSNVTFTSNSAYSGGGMLSNAGSPTLANATFTSNSATESGGAISSNEGFTLTNVTFANNSAHSGGAIISWGSSGLTNVTFTNNSATDGEGGGLVGNSGSLTMTNVIFSNNSASKHGGATYNTGNSTLTNVTFSGNMAGYAGGGIASIYGNSTLTNVTFVGNSAAYCGGMYSYVDSSTLTNVTFTNNSADGRGGGVCADGSATLRNAILWGNMGSISPQIDGSAIIRDSVVQGGCPSGSTCTNVISSDPLLGPLESYGGNTQTVPLLPGSSAIDAGNGTYCPAQDQRGVDRVGTCDIGAFESRGSTLAAVAGDNQWALLNTPFANPLRVSVTSLASPAEPVNGGLVTLTAPLSGASVLTPTQTITITNGTASALETANGTAGPYQVTASAQGASSVTFSLRNKATTTTTLTAAPNPSVFGQSVTFTATVTSSAGIPTGAVTLKNGGNTLSSGTLNASGVMTFSTSLFSAGSHAITAEYGGDTGSGSSTSSILNQTVNRATPTFSGLSSPIITYGMSPTVLSGTLKVGALVPTGSVSITLNSITQTAAINSADGSYSSSFATGSLPVSGSPYTVTYSYLGDANFSGALDNTKALTVNPAGTSTTLAAVPNPSTFGQTVLFTATITSTAGIPTGTVTFKDGGTVLYTGTLSSGVSTLVTSTLSAGTHSLSAMYNGAPNYGTSTSLPLTQTVAKANTTTTITGHAPNPSAVGQSVVVTFTVTSAAGTPTGNVTVGDGTATCSASVAVGHCSIVFNTAGNKTLVATYPGDSNYTGSSSAGVSHTVNPASTTTALAAAPNPSTFGQSVVLTATVTSAGGTPMGNVTFKDGTTTLGSGILASGVTTYTTLALTGGAHGISAAYGGDSNFGASTSITLTQTVNLAPTTTGLTASVNPSVFGQSVTFTATVSSSSGTPTGTVVFKDGATVLGTRTLSSGQASLTTTSLAVGSHLITADYGSEGNFGGSISSILTQAVNKANTTVGLGSSVNPSVFGQSVIFTATVAALAPGAGTPTGSVTFKDSATTLGTGTLSGGVATFTSTALALGSRAVTTVYAGDTNFDTSTASTLTQVVNKANTTTVLNSSPNPSVIGQTVTFTATVTATAPGSGTPTGTVTFKEGATILVTQTLSSGLATFATASLTGGLHTISATYNGDTNYNSSASGNLNQTVGNANTTTTLIASVNPTVFGQTVTFTATVAIVPPGTGTPSGTVTFKDGTTVIGTSALSGGQATFGTVSLAVGSHSITGTYDGDGSFNPSTSTILTQVVNKGNTTTALNSSVNPSVVGQSVTFTATVAVAVPGAGIPTGSVNFKDGATTLGTGSLSGGTATFTTSALTVGSHAITATYSGDTNFNSSTSATLTQVVNKANTTTNLISAPNPAVIGQSVTFTATVTAVAPGSGTATGTVTFKDGTTTIGTGTCSGGQATFTTSSLPVGNRSITAVYSGDTNFNANTSSVLVQGINKASTTTTVTSSANPSVVGQSVTFTATVTVPAPGAGLPTGSVTFKDGATTLGTGTLLGATATFSTTSLALGSHSIAATYGGDTSFNVSNSANLSQVVNKANTTTTVSSLANPASIGQSITFTATVSVTAPGSGMPTGTVTFKDGTTTIGTGTLSGGTATLVTSSLASGSHNITATYGGDANFNTSTSSTLTQTVNKASTATTISSSANPSVFGQSVTLTATVTAVAPGSGTPTGTVTFKGGAATLGSGTLSGGIATFTLSSLALGSHNITAVYGGDTSFATSTSSTLTQGVNKANTTTTLSASVNPSVVGQSVTFTATVSVVSPGSGTPTGAVAFRDGATTLGTGVMSGNTATFAISSLALGSHSITATYGGDTNLISSTSAILTQVVNKANTVTAVSSSANPSVVGQSVTFTATVTIAAPGGGTPTGSVTFKDGATTLGTGTLSGGQATFNTSSLALGPHNITATYAGDTNFNTSTSAIVSQSVNKANTTAAITASPNPSLVGQSVTFTAIVSAAAPGSGTPTGSITFKDATTTIGTSALASGTATFTTSSLSKGFHTITAVYGGDPNYNTSTSSILNQTVGNANTTTTISSLPNPAVLGQTVTFTATVTAVPPATGTPTGNVTLKDGATSIGTAALSSGKAAFTISTLGVGGHSITATYDGDADFNASTSSPLTQTVNKASTTTTLIVSPNPSLVGQSVTFTATVTVVAPGAGTLTGTVTFKDGATVLGTGTLSGSMATFTTCSLARGSHSFTAVYGGTTDLAGSTSAPLTQVVNYGSTLVAVSSSTNPSVTGEAVTFTATVSVPVPGCSGSVPIGAVTFKNGATTLGTGALSGGIATFSINSLDVGSHTITAVYAGDTNFIGSTSSPLTQVVNKASTLTTLSASVNPSVVGQSVTFTATVSVVAPGTGAPSGTITFKDGVTTLGTGTLANGTATLTTSLLTIGSHIITAEYGGNPNFGPSTSAGFSQTVNKASTMTALVSSINPSTLGQSVTFTATVTATAPGNANPSGSITFKDGPTTIGTSTLNAGKAVFATSALIGGSHSITAVYGGDTNLNGSTSDVLTQMVKQAGTTTVSSSANPSVFGQSVTFTATVSSVPPGNGTPSGTVTFKDGTSTLGTANLSGGQATLTAPSQSTGAHTISVVYGGDTNFNGSTSTPFSQTVNKASTTVALTNSVNPCVYGQSIIFTATVTVVLPGSGTPSGTVTFKDGATTLGTGSLSAGKATFTIATLGAGTHSITAVYAGDANFDTSTSGALTHTVNQATTSVTISSSSNPSGKDQPLTLTAIVTILPAGGGTATGTVTFRDGASILGTRSLSGGKATFTTSSLTVGSHSITATYDGDANCNSSTSTVLTQVINEVYSIFLPITLK